MSGTLQALLAGGNLLLALPVALAAGALAGLNPCCLPLYPAAATCCAALRRGTLRANIGTAIAFVLGVCAVTTTLGVVAGLVGGIFGRLPSWVGYALATVPLVFGLHLLGAVTLPLPKTGSPAMSASGGIWMAALAGAGIGLVITPCATPVLAGLLAYVAATGDPLTGGSVLFAYGVGLTAPMLLVGLGSASFAARLAASGRWRLVERATGAFLVALALYLVWRT